MKAIRYNPSIPRYITGRILSRIDPRFLWSGLSATYIEDISEPVLPSQDWVVVRSRYGGICGSDMSAINLLHVSPYYSPFISYPYTFGHENVGTIASIGKNVEGWKEGERVVVEPILWCVPRGFVDLCPFCAKGEINLCERYAKGTLAPGLMIGYCKDTGGSWSQYFLAHKSQLYRLPNSIDDENGLLIEPFAVSLHAVIQNYPRDQDSVLIIGGGTLGLCTLTALRSLGSKCEIVVLARYPFQADAARKLGANSVILADRENEYYNEIATLSASELVQPILGHQIVVGGIDQVFECVGSKKSLHDALRMTRNKGKVIVVGVPGIEKKQWGDLITYLVKRSAPNAAIGSKGIDWSPIFLKELSILAAYCYNHNEIFEGSRMRTIDLAIDIMSNGGLDLGWLVTHKFDLDDYQKAFSLQNKRGKHKVIRTVFAFDN